MEQVPEGFVAYRVRKVAKARVLYFNWELAKEMDLLPQRHSHSLNLDLREKLIEIFSLQIINEYDRSRKKPTPTELIKPNEYMATRYLQLQHSNKQGKTSGDGRSIWNGTVESRSGRWDVSSRGTGVTQLAPGAVLSDKPLKTGNTDIGYGCGMAELDELYATALMSELFHKQQLPTERTLLILDLGKGLGIGVRAALNLLRPAHLFLHLKQGNYSALKRATECFLERQFYNESWIRPVQDLKKYDILEKEICRGFAQLTARFDRDYIFTWLDWDGDNVLADAGIIDYGSVRQFGLRHDQYRYKDDDRFSTNLNEQKTKARQIVQTFVQLTDFLKTGQRSPLSNFNNHNLLAWFDQEFEKHCHSRFLYQAGFQSVAIVYLLRYKKKLVNLLFDDFLALEKLKTKRKMMKTPDGVNLPPLLNMRQALIEISGIIAEGKTVSSSEVFEKIKSTFASRKDATLSVGYLKRLHRFQANYKKLLRCWQIKSDQDRASSSSELHRRASHINRQDRITGNSITLMVEEILRVYKRGMDPEKIQKVVEHFIESQIIDPDYQSRRLTLIDDQQMGQLLHKMNSIVHEYREEV